MCGHLGLTDARDPLILSKISLVPLGETPLHISASFGHLAFTQKLLSIRPHGLKLAMELDRLQRSPLHLASAEGHTKVVQALIAENGGMLMCLAADKNGKIPLHYAAMRGHVEVIRHLILSQPRSIFKKLNEGEETVLHLCVQHNQLEALKFFVESCSKNKEFLNSKDQNGNTILHLAVMLKQVKTKEYLLTVSGVEKTPTGKSMLHRFMNKHNDDWTKYRNGSLMVVATVIATITYQTVVNPPGGVWRENKDNTTSCPQGKTCKAGTPLLGSVMEEPYVSFLIYDSMAFISSLVIVLLIVSGFPVRYRPCMWLLNVFICSALTFLTLTFSECLSMLSPLPSYGLYVMVYIVIYVWYFFLGICVLYLSIRFLAWIRKMPEFLAWIWKMYKYGFHHLRNLHANGNHSTRNDSALV